MMHFGNGDKPNIPRNRLPPPLSYKSTTVAKLWTQVANLSTGPPPTDYRLLTTSLQQME